MAGLIGVAEATSIREALSILLVHSCTITPYTAGSEDAHGNAAQTAGTPVTAVPCKYRPEDRVRLVNDEGGTTIVRAPTLTVAHDRALDETDTVSAITDSAGVVLLAGPIGVGPAVPSAGLGPTLKKKYILRGGEVTV